MVIVGLALMQMLEMHHKIRFIQWFIDIQFGATVVQNSGGNKKGEIAIELCTINSQIVDNYVVHGANWSKLMSKLHLFR